MIRFFSPLLAVLILASSCGSGKTQTSAKVLEAPGNLTVSDLTSTSAKLNWQGNAPDAEGYYVFLQTSVKPQATLGPEATSYTFQNLADTVVYRFGVQAYGTSLSLSKQIWVENITLPGPEPQPQPDPEPEPGPDPQPDPDPNPIEAITFTWTQVDGTPEGVTVYQTTDKLNNRPLQAWYAIADPKAVNVRVLYKGDGQKATIDKQAEDDGNCLVLINGGIFGGRPNGFAILDGIQTPWFRVEDDNWDVDRQYWGPNINGKADGKLHTVSRGLFGVDASGEPAVYWSYTPSYGTVYVYDQPIPSVEGEPVCPGGTDTYPCQRASWEPYNAITCGPVLLQNGKCPINDKKTDKGYWQTNYEMWASDIFGVDELHDRTAVGYTEDGKVILFICDGRIDASKGANTLEMAAIMKGLGCVGALNLDGGGSTGMWISGLGHINDLTGGNRAVMTTIGFFKK